MSDVWWMRKLNMIKNWNKWNSHSNSDTRASWGSVSVKTKSVPHKKTCQIWSSLSAYLTPACMTKTMRILKCPKTLDSSFRSVYAGHSGQEIHFSSADDFDHDHVVQSSGKIGYLVSVQDRGGGHPGVLLGKLKYKTAFLSTPVLMHGGLICIAFCPSVRCHWTKIQEQEVIHISSSWHVSKP